MRWKGGREGEKYWSEKSRGLVVSSANCHHKWEECSQNEEMQGNGTETRGKRRREER